MLTVIVKRLLVAIPSLIGVVIVTFLLTRALPGDPAAYFAGPAATQEAIAGNPRQARARQVAAASSSCAMSAISRAATSAQSLTTGQPVVTEIRNRLPGLGRAHAARPDRVDRDRDPARHLRGRAAELAGSTTPAAW